MVDTRHTIGNDINVLKSNTTLNNNGNVEVKLKDSGNSSGTLRDG
jgi:hypothetical protein